MRYRTAHARRFPPAFGRWWIVLPLDAGLGQIPQSMAKAASAQMGSGSSPKTIAIRANVPAEKPEAAMSAGTCIRA